MQPFLSKRRGFAALVIAAATIAGSTAIAGASVNVVTANAHLTDLDPTHVNPTDGASAFFTSIELDGLGTRSILVVTGMSADSVGSTFGAHVHIGPCDGIAADALGHYREPGQAVASPESEIWLDFTVLPGGVGIGRSSVGFTIPAGGAGAVVIHAMSTDSTGNAGARIACLPASF